jgi:hypothetical protein
LALLYINPLHNKKNSTLPRQLQEAPQQLPHRVLLPARHALEDLHDQDSVVGSGGFDSDPDGLGY